MKAVFSGALIAVLLGGSAVAADLPLKAPPAPAVAVPTWTGTYIGINGGWGHATSRHTPLSGTVLGTSDFDQDGGMAGITYGGNWQSGQWVLGFESDLDWADMKGSVTDGVACSSNGGATCFTKLKTFSTTRMRAGIDLDGWLLFGTAGAGFGRVDAGQDPCGVTPFGGNSCNEKWRTGWVAGAGIEKMFAPNWSAKLEYLHFDFGDDIQYTPAVGVPVRVLERGDMVRLGINYHFDLLGLLHLN